MKVLKLILCAIIIYSCKSQSSIDIKANAKPNIIIFLVDDMGWQDTSLPFWKEKTKLNETYHTPNMEKLAANGMKFSQAYASPICSPSRVSLITGTNPARHRVTNWTLEYNKSNDEPNDLLEPPKWNVNGISNHADIPYTYSVTTLPELLQKAGYYTIHIGKAHFAAMGTEFADPINMGFNVNIAGHAAGGLQNYEGKVNFGNIPQKSTYQATPDLQEFYGKDIFLTEAITQKAIKELNKRPKNQPFFLYLSHYAIHVPIMGDGRFLQKYLDKGMNEIEAKYASMIEGMDKSLGDIMSYLKANHIDDNTLILFLSDNGGLDVYARGLAQNTANAPLSSGKGTLREGGVRIPFIASWQGKIKQGTISSQLIAIEDIFPTILNVAELKPQNIKQIIDGKSFLPTLFSKDNKQASEEKIAYWHLPNQWFTPNEKLGIYPSSAIRKGDFKLIYYHHNQKIELYNLQNDIGEKNDISKLNPLKTKELAKLLSNYLRNVKAQMPTIKKSGKVVPFPDEL